MANESKETIIIELQIKDASGGKSLPKEAEEVKELATSIVGLQKENKKLREERNKVDTSTEQGIKKIKELNASIDKNNEKIKENSSSLEKQRLNVGNYTSALDRLFPGLGGVISKMGEMSQASGGVVGGIQAMIKSSLAFIATPIGAILTALVAVLGLVSSYFKRSEEGADKFAKISAVVSAVVGVLFDRLTQLGGALVAFFTGDFEGGLNKLEGAFSGVGDEMEREIALAQELADILDDLEERELRYSLAVSETANEIKKLIIESKNRTLTEQQRIDKLTEASNKEIALNEELTKIQKERIDATARQIQADFSQLQSQKQADESAIDFAKRIIANESILIDRRTELAELLKSYNQTQGESLNLQEKIQNQQDALVQKEIERLEKQIEERAKILNAQYEKELEDQKSILEATAELEAADGINREEEEKERLRRRTEYLAEANRVDTENYRAAKEEQIRIDEVTASEQAAIDRARFMSKLQNLRMITEAATAAASEGTKLQKISALGTIAIDTAEAISGLIAASEGNPANAVTFGGAGISQYAVGILRILGNVNRAREIISSFALGGQADKFGTFNGPSHSGGGINYIREDGKHKINVEGGENFYVLKKSASREINRLSSLNQKHGGVSWDPSGTYPTVRYASGGQVIASQSPQDSSSIERVVRSVMATMPPIYVVAQDVSQVLDTDNEIKQRARVL